MSRVLSNRASSKIFCYIEQMKKYHYLLTLLFVFCIPMTVAGVYLSKVVDLQVLTPFIILVTAIGSIWDIWATRHGRKDRIWLWQFNRTQTIGIRFFGLPGEEYLFYVASSVYVIFMWEGFKLMMRGASLDVYIAIGLLSVWTLFSILLPYFLGRKTDRFIG